MTAGVEREPRRTWTAWLRGRAARAMPPDKLLPDRQPAYVASWIYVFGVLTLAALLVVLASGALIALSGPAWYHTSTVGHFANSLHLWSVELFFFFMVIHLWGKFFMAAWRGRRVLTWVTGVVAFVASIGTAFTGYVVQSNFDSQWISTQAKDGLNSVGIGAWFNVLNLGQMLLWHVLLLPLGLGILVVLHVLLVRRRGVVPPFPEDSQATAAPESDSPRRVSKS
jgi:quinol-cytochrome oxidoreductase complex cytochrome b subunit